MGNCTSIQGTEKTRAIEIGNKDKHLSNNIIEDLTELEDQVIARGIPGKKAVLVGLNYTGTSIALQGCINDANRMKQTLKDKFGYKDVTVLTDRNITKQKNILELLDELIASKNNTMYFQYSGHGVQQYDRSGDETDRMDEALYSVDGTIITDDQINQRIRKVSEGKTLILVIDACHSGTMVDLPYQLKGDNIVKINNNQVTGDVICISGCRDNQVSMDIKKGNTAYGAMSNALQQVLKGNGINRKTDWRSLVNQIGTELKKNKYAQVPQLCVSRPELINMVVSI